MGIHLHSRLAYCKWLCSEHWDARIFSNHFFLQIYKQVSKRQRTRDQIANMHWIMEKAREFQKNICFIDYAKAFDGVDHNKL